MLKGLIHRAVGKELDGKSVSYVVAWREAWRELAFFSTLTRFSDLQWVQRENVKVEQNLVSITFVTRKIDELTELMAVTVRWP